MEQINFAAIDIGSNAVRLLIKGIYKGETANQLKKTFIVRVPLAIRARRFHIGQNIERQNRTAVTAHCRIQTNDASI